MHKILKLMKKELGGKELSALFFDQYGDSVVR